MLPKRIINVLKIINAFKKLIGLKYCGYLFQKGWIETLQRRIPIDKNENPIPWMTYPFIDFIEKRLKRKMCIFEFGSGNSTLYFSKKVETVVAVEHDKLWYNKILRTIPSNAKIIYQDYKIGDRYVNAIKETKKDFDIIIVDGRKRVDCIKNCLKNLNETGCIILDNSEREKYQPINDFLSLNRFKRLDFWGMGPIKTTGWCTTVFYRKDNCLNI